MMHLTIPASNSAHISKMSQTTAKPATLRVEPERVVNFLEKTLKELDECQSDLDIQEVSSKISSVFTDSTGCTHGNTLEAIQNAELALRQDGQLVKAKRMANIGKLMKRLPKLSAHKKTKKQRKILREILKLCAKNVGVTIGKRSFCCGTNSLLCNAAILTGSVLVVAGATTVIAMAAAGQFDDPADMFGAEDEAAHEDVAQNEDEFAESAEADKESTELTEKEKQRLERRGERQRLREATKKLRQKVKQSSVELSDPGMDEGEVKKLLKEVKEASLSLDQLAELKGCIFSSDGISLGSDGEIMTFATLDKYVEHHDELLDNIKVQVATEGKVMRWEDMEPSVTGLSIERLRELSTEIPEIFESTAKLEQEHELGPAHIKELVLRFVEDKDVFIDVDEFVDNYAWEHDYLLKQLIATVEEGDITFSDKWWTRMENMSLDNLSDKIDGLKDKIETKNLRQQLKQLVEDAGMKKSDYWKEMKVESRGLSADELSEEITKQRVLMLNNNVDDLDITIREEFDWTTIDSSDLSNYEEKVKLLIELRDLVEGKLEIDWDVFYRANMDHSNTFTVEDLKLDIEKVELLVDIYKRQKQGIQGMPFNLANVTAGYLTARIEKTDLLNELKEHLEAQGENGWMDMRYKFRDFSVYELKLENAKLEFVKQFGIDPADLEKTTLMKNVYKTMIRNEVFKMGNELKMGNSEVLNKMNKIMQEIPLTLDADILETFAKADFTQWELYNKLELHSREFLEILKGPDSNTVLQKLNELAELVGEDWRTNIDWSKFGKRLLDADDGEFLQTVKNAIAHRLIFHSPK